MIKICISQRTGGQEKAHESQSNFIQLGPGKSKPARSSEIKACQAHCDWSSRS